MVGAALVTQATRTLYAPAPHNAPALEPSRAAALTIGPFWPFLGDFRQFRRKNEELHVFTKQTKIGLFLARFWACPCKTWRISPIYRRATEGLTFGKVQGVQMCYICPGRRRDYRARLGEQPQAGFCPRPWVGVIASGDPAGPSPWIFGIFGIFGLPQRARETKPTAAG